MAHVRSKSNNLPLHENRIRSLVSRSKNSTTSAIHVSSESSTSAAVRVTGTLSPVHRSRAAPHSVHVAMASQYTVFSSHTTTFTHTVFALDGDFVSVQD